MLLRLAPTLCCAVLFAGCGGTTIVKTVTAPAATTSTSDGPSASASTDEAPVTASPVKAEATVGDALSLDVSDTTLRITVKSVIDPLATGDYDEADAGMRFVGVRLSIENDGDVAYSDSPSNGTTLVTREDEQADPTIVSGGPCANSFGSDLKLAAGDKRIGCIAFEVPAGQRLRSFQFTGDSGFADDTGEWRLPSRAPRSAAVASSSADPGTSGAGRSYTACDANISAAVGSTSCAFAQNVFYEYFVSGESTSISAYSPATGGRYDLDCDSSGAYVTCEADDGGAVRFTQSAIDSYSSGQAADYASSHDVG